MTKTRKLTTMAMLIALSVVLVAVIHLPIFPAVPFLEYDPADIPILVGAFAFGPLAGLIITVVASVIQGLTVSAGSSWYGIVMHILATGTFAVIAGGIYRAKKTRKRAAIGMLVALVATMVVMFGANLVITPMFTGWPVSSIMDLMWVGIMPFNLVKFVINGLVVFLVYKPISNLIKIPDKALVDDKTKA